MLVVALGVPDNVTSPALSMDRLMVEVPAPLVMRISLASAVAAKSLSALTKPASAVATAS